MTIRELIELLSQWPQDYEVYVNASDEKEDYFVDTITAKHSKRQVFIETAS